MRGVGRRIFKPAKIRRKLIREKSSSNYSTLVKRVVVTIEVINALHHNNASHRNNRMMIMRRKIKMVLIYHLILPLIRANKLL